MKKILSIIAAAMLICLTLIGCSNGKCDECGEKATTLTKAAQDKGLEGEFCENCMKTIVNLGK